MDSPGHTAQVRRPSRPGRPRIPGWRWSERAGHAGDAAAYHQGPLVDGQLELLQRLQRRVRATDMRTMSLAFLVASSFSLEWTQEQCSRILAMS